MKKLRNYYKAKKNYKILQKKLKRLKDYKNN